MDGRDRNRVLLEQGFGLSGRKGLDGGLRELPGLLILIAALGNVRQLKGEARSPP